MDKNEYDGFLKFAIFALAAYLFSKTAEVLSYFAPQALSALVGWDVSQIYGAGNAILLEGVAVAIHFKRELDKNGMAQITKWAFLAVSAACQVFDGFITTDTMANQSDTIKAIFSWGVPLIPLFMMLMLFAIGGGTPNAQKKPFVGIKNMLPNPARLWHGDDYKPTSKPSPKREDKPKGNPQEPPR